VLDATLGESCDPVPSDAGLDIGVARRTHVVGHSGPDVVYIRSVQELRADHCPSLPVDPGDDLRLRTEEAQQGTGRSMEQRKQEEQSKAEEAYGSA